MLTIQGFRVSKGCLLDHLVGPLVILYCPIGALLVVYTLELLRYRGVLVMGLRGPQVGTNRSALWGKAEEISRRYENGESSCQLAKVYGATPYLITRILRAQGTRIRSKREARLLQQNHKGSQPRRLPSPQEIAAECAKLREEWDDAREQKALGVNRRVDCELVPLSMDALLYGRGKGAVR